MRDGELCFDSCYPPTCCSAWVHLKLEISTVIKVFLAFKKSSQTLWLLILIFDTIWPRQPIQIGKHILQNEIYKGVFLYKDLDLEQQNMGFASGATQLSVIQFSPKRANSSKCGHFFGCQLLSPVFTSGQGSVIERDFFAAIIIKCSKPIFTNWR